MSGFFLLLDCKEKFSCGWHWWEQEANRKNLVFCPFSSLTVPWCNLSRSLITRSLLAKEKYSLYSSPTTENKVQKDRCGDERQQLSSWHSPSLWLLSSHTWFYRYLILCTNCKHSIHLSKKMKVFFVKMKMSLVSSQNEEPRSNIHCIHLWVTVTHSFRGYAN